MNAPVFLLYLGKQVFQGCNREITKKNLFNVQIMKPMEATSQCTE